MVNVTYREMPEMAANIIDKFWGKVCITANSDTCWEWNGGIRGRDKPYGRFFFGKGTFISAHRISYYLSNNIDPKELCVLHNCDNPKCVNPKHLFLGTNADNVADKVSKGRQAKNVAWSKGLSLPYQQGSLNHSAKLTEQQVVKIREEYKEGKTSSLKLKDKYNVSKPTILNIIHRKIWKHI